MIEFFGRYVKDLSIATALLLFSLAMAGPAWAAGEITGFTILGVCKESGKCNDNASLCNANNITLYVGDQVELCLDPQDGFANLKPEQVSLTINGQVISNSHPVLKKADSSQQSKDVMSFVIPSASEQDWYSTLRTHPIADQKKASTSSSDPKSEVNSPQQENQAIFYKNVAIGIALSGKPASVSKIGFPVDFSIFSRWHFFAMILAVVLPLAGMVYLAVKTNALRDRGLQPLCRNERPPYSLARCQAAFWFLIVFASYAFLALFTSAYTDIINSTALTLMGIGSGTALGAAMIDAGRLSEEEKSTVEPLLQQQVLLTEAINSEKDCNPSRSQVTAMDSEASNVSLSSSTVGQNTSATNSRKRLEELESEIRRIAPKMGPRVGQTFYKDLLTDKDGISFHRFQMLCWTLMLGVFFIYSVFSGYKMPIFDGGLYVLIGISSGTYLGFKFPEKHA